MSKLSFKLTTLRVPSRLWKTAAYITVGMLNHHHNLGYMSAAEQRKFVRDLRHAADKLEKELNRAKSR